MSQFNPSDLTFEAMDGASIGVCLSMFNGTYVNALFEDALQCFSKRGVEVSQEHIFRVPGAGELPYVANRLAFSGDYDAILVLGCVIAGETIHDEVIAHSTAKALQAIALKSEVPVINGIVTVRDEAQAKARCMGKTGRGEEFALGTLAMASLAAECDDRWGSLAELAEEDMMEELADMLDEGDDDDDDFPGKNPFKFN